MAREISRMSGKTPAKRMPLPPEPAAGRSGPPIVGGKRTFSTPPGVVRDAYPPVEEESLLLSQPPVPGERPLLPLREATEMMPRAAQRYAAWAPDAIASGVPKLGALAPMLSVFAVAWGTRAVSWVTASSCVQVAQARRRVCRGQSWLCRSNW